MTDVMLSCYRFVHIGVTAETTWFSKYVNTVQDLNEYSHRLIIKSSNPPPFFLLFPHRLKQAFSSNFIFSRFKTFTRTLQLLNASQMNSLRDKHLSLHLEKIKGLFRPGLPTRHKGRGLLVTVQVSIHRQDAPKMRLRSDHIWKRSGPLVTTFFQWCEHHPIHPGHTDVLCI